MQRVRVLVIGGYGFFGSRLVQRLARQARLHVLVGGRSLPSAQAQVDAQQPQAQARLEAVALDAMAPWFAQALAALNPSVVVHASGPFQGQDYRVAQACIAQGAHYIDLADGRAFVTGIGVLDAAARAAGVLVTSGASSVPALSSAAADRMAEGLTEVHEIDIGISPGNRTERGLSTVQGILSYCGQPIPTGGGPPRIGWGRTYPHRYPAPVGRRLLSPCDVPDLALLPGRYPSLPSVRFGAGLELTFLHRGMNVMAWLAQVGVVGNWARHARLLKRAADLFRHWGSDAGAMHVRVSGRSQDGVAVTHLWELLATHGDGPFVPTLAAAALVRRLSGTATVPVGAMPCLGLLTLDDFSREAEGLNIITRMQA
ncbi:MAG TPA: saccharopine dehydrogenase NADP-binding domain-containing protein [Ramlibacter sp.]|nr:saccharopine dehydrogenase NADP-binding domain-containing protein [Ramlibacter sp.]